VRLFLAIPLQGPAHLALTQSLLRWRRQLLNARWEAPEALHLTLQFIGPWPQARESELIAALADLRLDPLSLRLAGLGAFPNPRQPRIVWAGVVPHFPLAAWVAAIAARLQPLGIQREPRPFTPHISLARLTAASHAHSLRFDPHRPHWGELPADHFGLYHTLPDAPPAQRYQLRYRFPTSPSTHLK